MHELPGMTPPCLKLAARIRDAGFTVYLPLFFGRPGRTNNRLQNAQALVCGFAGLPHFNAPTLARLWNREQPLAARTILLDATPAAGWSTASLAAHLERSVDSLLPHLNHMSSPRVMRRRSTCWSTTPLNAHGRAPKRRKESSDNGPLTCSAIFG